MKFKNNSPLTMGWCIDCHRKLIKMEGNEYTQKFMMNFQKEYSVDKLTAAQMEV
jgi:hypothetical protein